MILVPLVLGVLVLILLALHRWDPAGRSVVPACAFHRLTGWYCPGCGGSRAVHDLLHRRFLAALDHNLLIFPLLILTGYPLLKWLCESACAVRLPGFPWNSFFWYAVSVIVVAFGILRNLPFAWSRFLAP